jgi:hypothetical protein
MAIGISANVASTNNQSILKENKNGLKSSDKSLDKSTVSVEINANHSQNTQFANSDITIDMIKDQRMQMQSKLNIDFEKESSSFDKSSLSQISGSILAAQANVNKEAALNLL